LTKATAPRSAVLVDPHPLWLDAVEGALAHVDVEVVARATSLGAASRCVGEAWPDIVVGETTYADDLEAGLRWIASIAAEFPATKIVVFSACREQTHVSATLARGADAYVLKHCAVEDFITVVRQVFQPSVFFRPEAPRPVTLEMSLPTAQALTPREVDILRLASEGHSNVRIARILWVTEQTVKFHLSNVYRKIGVANRTEAGRWAQVHGILESPPVAERDQPA
jgi:DNA-binding NarL/FixJ family response regulator